MLTVINTLAGLDVRDVAEVRRYWSGDALRTLYFEPKKLGVRASEEALDSPSFLSHLERTADLCDSCDVGDLCGQIVGELEEDAGYGAPDVTLYLVLGCGTTTIYSIEVDGKEASVLCVESLGGSTDVLRMYLAHEYTHWVRKQLLNADIFESCIGERLVTEGIAEYYSREVVPGRSVAEYCIVDESAAAWVQDNEAALEALVRDDLEGTGLMETLFYMYARTEFPPRCGYVYGYLVVKRYLERHRVAVKDILDIHWQDVLRDYL